MADKRRALPPHERKRLHQLKNAPKKASSMGLPVETRVQIYGYLVIPRVDPASPVSKRYTTREHCCALASRKESFDMPFNPKAMRMSCLCDGLAPCLAILQTSKQVFNEAMQVFYENMELRIALPCVSRTVINCERLHTTVTMPKIIAPDHATSHVTRVLLVGNLNDGVEEDMSGGGKAQAGIELLCNRMRDELPKLKEVRLHLESWYTDPATASYAAYGCLASLLAVRKISVCVCRSKWVMSLTASTCDAAREAVATAIREKAKALGKAVKVVEEERTAHPSFP